MNDRVGNGSVSDGELRLQRERIDAELEAREAEYARLAREAAEDKRERARAARKREREALPTVGEWVEFEHTCCTRPSCRICGGSQYAHGPYWFHYFRSHSGKQTSRYVGLVLDERAAGVLAAHEDRQRAKVERSREVAALRRGEAVDVPDEGRVREAGGLVGMTPQEAYPEAFSGEERVDAARRKDKKQARDQRKAEREKEGAEARQGESART